MRHLLFSLALLISVSTVFADDGQQLIVQQWVTPNPEGRMDAVFVSPGMQDDTLQPGQIQVNLASQDGTIYRAEAYPDSSREFSFAGVPAGTYTMMARVQNFSLATQFTSSNNQTRTSTRDFTF